MNNTIQLIEKINSEFDRQREISKKTDEYLDYIYEHKHNVEKAWDIIKTIDNPYIQNNLDEISKNIKNHDASKFSGNEFEWYRKKYYPIDDEEANEVMDKIEDIFQLHYSRNPHHWEYWLNHNGELDKSKHSSEEIDEDIMIAYIEMLCDWASFGIKKGNPREVRTWYISEKPKMTLWPKEQEILEEILKEYINKFPEEEDE